MSHPAFTPYSTPSSLLKAHAVHSLNAGDYTVTFNLTAALPAQQTHVFFSTSLLILLLEELLLFILISFARSNSA